MALPTLQPFYITRRSQPRAERLIVQRRNHEADVKEKWKNNSHYFSNSGMRASKQEAWTSSQCFMDSMAAYESRGKAEEKKELLKERREKLATLLAEDRQKYEEELKESASSKYVYMKNRADHLKTQRVEQEKKLADEKLHEHWKANCPELRKVESRQMQQAVQEEWEDQIKWREREVESARRENERYDLAMQEDRVAALKLEEDLKARKKMSEQDYVESLHLQMSEVRAREEEAAMLEEQQAALFREQAELDKAEEERRRLEEARRKSDLGRVLLRQHKAQMRRKSRQIQESLDLDLKILENLVIKEQEDLSVQTARREKARADVQWMKQVVSEQLELERRRERELEQLFQEEAARMWHRREEEWERERKARTKLMAEVLAERQMQINIKMENIKEQQAESIQRREDLLQEMELFKQTSAREIHAREREKTQRIKELAQQVRERERQASRELEIDAIELERQRQVDDNYHGYLVEETSRLNTRKASPKFYGRRKHAWS